MESAVGYELAVLNCQLAEMCAMAAEAMNHATHALLLADIDVAEAVIAERDEIAAMSASAEETTFRLLAWQRPVAGELRVMVNAIRIAADAERMGEVALQVAEIARRHYPRHAVPADVSGRVAELSAMAVQLACAAQEVLLSRDPRLAADLRRDDGAVHRLYRQLLSVLIDPNWGYGVARGVDVAVVSLLYERFADYAVHLAERYTFHTNGYRLPVQPRKVTPLTNRRR